MIVFRLLHTVWAMLVFFILLVLGVVVFFFASFLGKYKLWVTLYYNKFWVYTWGALTGVRFITKGRERLEKRPYVYVTNHTSMVDSLTVNAAIPRPFMPMAKAEIKKIPLLGYIFGQVSIWVDRSSFESRRKSMEQLVNHTKNGISVMLFPEGTRNRSTEQPLKSFHSGAFRTAIAAQLPIAPFIIIGGRDVVPGERLLMHPATITSIFSDPIETKGLTEADADALKDKVYAVMDKLLRQHDPLFQSKN